MKKLLLVINPNAGKGMMAANLMQTIEIFSNGGYLVEVYPTKAEGDATRVVSERGEDYDCVVCCGGDGTVNETVAGLLALSTAPNFGIIPCGTTNDFSHTLGLPDTPLEAARVICKGNTTPCDVGKLNDTPFVYVAAVGMFTELTYETRQDFKQILGSSAYMLEALRNLSNIATVHLRAEYDGGVIEGEYLICLISNTVSMAGFRRMFENKAELADGVFEVTLVKPPTKMEELQKALSVLLSLNPIDDSMECITVFSTKQITITTAQPMPWTIDGQSAGTHDGVNIKVMRHALLINN